jgi:hypothetical protein
MHPMESLNELRATGRMRWIGSADAWLAEADEVMCALARDGFEECKHEEARDRRHHARNGVWQGLNRATGGVASAVWVVSDYRQHLVFIDIDGEPLRGDRGAG